MNLATGGSVVSELLKDKKWKIRAATRNLTGSKAKSLESMGVDLVYADFEKPETLADAVKVSQHFYRVDTGIAASKPLSRERRSSLALLITGNISRNSAT